METINSFECLVSIIIPIYNVEKYLRECIESALKQTYKSIELILVDDGSPDNCPQICDEYAKQDSKVKVIHKSNGGLSDARNAGLAAAKGEYVYFLDSDDFIAENTIKELYDEAKKNNLDVVLFDGFVVEEDGKLDKSNNYYVRKHEYKNLNEGKTLFAEMANNSDYRSGVPFLFIRKAFIIDSNLFFYKGILHEDELFTFLLLMKCKKARHLSQSLYYRRKRYGSIMSVPKNEKNFLGCFYVLEEMIKYYTTNKFETYVGKTVRKHIASFFKSTHNIYLNLSKREQKINIKNKKQMFVFIRKARYLYDWRVFIICRFELVYKRAIFIKRNILRGCS